MGSPVHFTTLLSVVLYVTSIQTQDLKDQDVLCNENSCLVLYSQRKLFLDAWRSCKSQGGNLVTITSPQEARMVETLFSKIELRDSDRMRIWIGLQRLPRKCSKASPMRGFTWVTGEHETSYTNWQDEESLAICSTPRCVAVSYSTHALELQNNLKWKDDQCSMPVDAYLCRYAFPGMCQPIMSEGAGNALYNTPFQLVTAFLTQIPPGSSATVPCITKGDQTVQCMQIKAGTVSWNREPPYCYDDPKTSWCDKDNGGCNHNCIEDGEHAYCECNEGFLLAEDQITCFPIDPCQGAPCEFECLAVMESYRCACPDSYMLAPDEQHCVDVDECLQSPCEYICINTPGSFECHCRDGYQSEEGTCEDVDECAEYPCEHACENVMGSYICHCHLGYAPLPEDPSQCHDIDECQIEGTCEQMCHNYIGGFECFCGQGYELQPDNSCRLIDEDEQHSTVTASYPLITHLPHPIWEPDGTEYPWTEDSDTDWNSKSPDGLYNLDSVPTHLPWFTTAHQKEAESTHSIESSPGIISVERDEVDLPVTSMENFLPSTATPVPDYYEDESTTEPTALPTTTVGGGAWKWSRTSPTSKGLNKVQTTQSPLTTLDGVFDYKINKLGPESQTQLILFTEGKEEPIKDSSNWLLVGLLVPLCIFIVVMAVLGIVYCRRCTAKPQNTKAPDCYHWIAGAGDKAAADMAGGRV
ncbi:CD248 molecule, endosialin a [Electrophorus electricus]|uniref:CD248 molecule, endosialin a n=1 Tax=Electrophorus electricus TaxID=8005 RepID=UPI0015D033BB|nr:CD248 molecule, endosialin a [Electrophorus electricus]